MELGVSLSGSMYKTLGSILQHFNRSRNNNWNQSKDRPDQALSWKNINHEKKTLIMLMMEGARPTGVIEWEYQAMNDSLIHPY
jgi:hypothetical protein